MLGPGTDGGYRLVERDEFHVMNSSQMEQRRVGYLPVTHEVRYQLAKGGRRQRRCRFHILMMRMDNETLE